METGSPHRFEWAKPTTTAPNDLCISHQCETWIAFDSSSEQTLSTSPYLVAQNSFEQSDRSTEFDGLSPFELCRDFTRDPSFSVEQLKNELLWTRQQPDGFQKQRKDSLLCEKLEQQSPTRCLPSRHTRHDSNEARNGVPLLDTKVEPVKRKRGRPRLYSPLSELQEPDVSSNRSLSARKSQLEKNRVAANKCRQRKKEYTIGLTAKASDLCSRNTALKAEMTELREQVLNLKNEVLRHARCGSWAIDRYVARSAGDLCGAKSPSIQQPTSTASSQARQSTVSSNRAGNLPFVTNTKVLPSQGSVDFRIELDDYDSLWLINDEDVMEDL